MAKRWERGIVGCYNDSTRIHCLFVLNGCGLQSRMGPLIVGAEKCTKRF